MDRIVQKDVIIKRFRRARMHRAPTYIPLGAAKAIEFSSVNNFHAIVGSFLLLVRPHPALSVPLHAVLGVRKSSAMRRTLISAAPRPIQWQTPACSAANCQSIDEFSP